MASANPKTVQGGRLKATRNGAQPMLPGLDALRRAKAPRPPKPPKAPRTPKPKLTPIQREALKVADPEAREACGKALHAELKSVKAKLLAARAARLRAPPVSPEQQARIAARFPDTARLKSDEGYQRDCKRAFTEAYNGYSDDLARLHAQIVALTAQQNEIFYAYASDATRVAWEAGRAEREAAKAERERLYHLAQGPF
jgi:hypothetical protein